MTAAATAALRSQDATGVPLPRAQATGVTVELVTGASDFIALETEWNRAVERAAIPHPFLRHEWVRAWWDAFGGSASLFIVVVRSGDGIAAIAPLMRESTQMYGVPVRCLRFLANDHTPRTDVIVAADSGAAYRAIWDTLRSHQHEWDVLQLTQLPQDSPTAAIVSSLAEGDGCSIGVWAHGDSPYLTLEGSWESYLASRPAKFRSNLRNRIGRLEQIGKPALEVLRDPDAIEQALGDAWRLEDSGWKGDEGTAIASDSAVRRFYSQLASRGARAGWLELMFLRVGERRIATSYGAAFGNRLFLFKTGYDPEFATGAPFKVLTYHAIQDAYARGLTELDFLGDAEPWKLEWTATARSHQWLFVFADTVRARLLRSVKFRWIPELKRWRA